MKRKGYMTIGAKWLILTAGSVIIADRPRVTGISVRETECPTLYIAGDSTVTDQSAEYPYAAGTSYAGWGQMLPA